MKNIGIIKTKLIKKQTELISYLIDLNDTMANQNPMSIENVGEEMNEVFNGLDQKARRMGVEVWAIRMELKKCSKKRK